MDNNKLPIVKLDTTLKELHDRARRISWSKIQQFESCKATWFFRNIADFVVTQDSAVDNNWSIQGTILQKVLEVFINNRLYREKNREEQIKWLQENSIHVFNLIALPVEEQFNIENSRHWFTTQEGKQKIDEELNKGMDHRIDGLSPQFIDYKWFNENRGGIDNFLEENNALYEKILKEFDNRNINLDHILSEHYIEVQFDQDITLNGSIDFIYNKYQALGCFDRIKDLQDNYTILDGKYKKSSYLKENQLNYYATLLNLKYKKIASHCGFFIWRDGKIKNLKRYNKEYLKELKEAVKQICDFSDQLIEELTHHKKTGDYLVEYGDDVCLDSNHLTTLELNPQLSACTFCNINHICEKGKHINLNKINKWNNDKKVIKESLDRSNYVEGAGIQEISL